MYSRIRKQNIFWYVRVRTYSLHYTFFSQSTFIASLLINYVVTKFTVRCWYYTAVKLGGINIKIRIYEVWLPKPGSECDRGEAICMEIW